MFETFAVISTLACIAIFVTMYRVDRASRSEDGSGDSQR